ncbi:PTS lactose/cellobiose transporter subunit IIA [Clostridium algidicarnis]|uniref:PTS lactose/cellobiose transporter subunit IIA n=1 Tax=Clostridium algidicarnis TaxID=37659 RepID=UPI001C0B26AA|nr:PTS lactose/cellobiose transporter subunit IIA [Clostridium algidicarnis]MBU3203956.1 PTS lactose/cellobiose transporter subunit IIA [Clostridium algidicarnis]MBU3212110.1 PTS lactose/cellobiose transporter subunit IIA [Clostridium algidicarnis]MBU3221385.1 PTS lactose/cellobiose transporter subunit IIA [Clostridium algidicarnis]
MEEQTNLEVIMELIMYGGDAKSNAMEAIQAAKLGNFELAKTKINEAEASLTKAHHAQTAMLTQEAQGNQITVTLLMVHGQDHLMTSMAFTDLAKEIIEVYKKIDEK